MIARTRLKLRNTEKSLTFMQEQHAKTLEGLHQEIDKLQKKNARLIFQLIMNGGTSGQLQLEDNLIASRSELAKVQAYLIKEQEKVSLLNHQVDDLLSKYTEDITVRDNLIKRLNVELNSKANMIVLLTQQIHHIRTKLKQELESKITKALICSCPHCCVHNKILESKQREKKRRKVDHRHNHLPDTDQNSLASTFSAVSGIQTRHFNPTPPLSPPPSSATGWCPGIVRRASTPVRRNSSPTDTHTILSGNQMGTAQDDHTHNIHRIRRQHIQSQSVWESHGYDISRERTWSQDELQQVLSLKSFEGENSVIHTKLICRDSPPILPPIVTSPLSNAEYLEQHDSCNGSSSAVFSHIHCQELDVVVDSSVLQQRHMVSYKFPVLSSASPSSLCILRRCQAKRDMTSKTAPGSCGPKGILLVKEDGEKLSSTTPWEKGTPALD